jgi:hypothetical protein
MTSKIKALRGVWQRLYGGRLGWRGPRPKDGGFVPPPGLKAVPEAFLGREAEETGAMPAWKPGTKA